jgi:MFS family permease
MKAATQTNPSDAVQPSRRVIGFVVLVAALGYFVDIFDLLLFGLVRKDSLRELMQAELAGKSPAEVDALIASTSIVLDNILQTSGLLVGGLVWGIIADRSGRMKVLFGSILTYSVANLLNAWVTDVHQYGALRFVAGFGLAGELGAGITLVSELVGRERRGLATTFVAAVGILGAVAGYFVTQLVSWRGAFTIGGLLGLSLLVLRIGVVESGLFLRAEHMHARHRGAFWMLFWPWPRLRRYMATVLIAVPIWFVVGTLVKYCDVIMPSLGLPMAEKPSPGKAIMWCYVGLAAGDLGSGLLSQLLKSRRKAIAVFHAMSVVGLVLYFTVAAQSLTAFYAVICFVGFACGYWAVFATIAAEQFGTNLRATAATTAPNIVRWSAAWTGGLWLWLSGSWGSPWQAALLVAVVVLPIAMVATLGIRESYGIDLDFEEE